MPETPRDLAQLIIERRRKSLFWMKDNFYAQFQQVFKSYKCERDPEVDFDNNPDPTRSSVGMPDTWSHVRRTVARVTAQIPHIKFRCKEREIGDKVSSTVMYQWDRGGVQRLQKKHVAQAALFGWSVRPWYWAIEDFKRTRRINPLDPKVSGDPDIINAISETYDIPPESLSHPEDGPVILAQLLAEKARGGLLPIKYDYVAYQGPKCDWLFVGDCYPEPNFQSLQTSNWFIVERRRNEDWINRIVKRFPELGPGLEELMKKYPDGTPLMPMAGDRDTTTLRAQLNAAIDRTANDKTYSGPSALSREWTVTEMYAPGIHGKLSFMGQDDIAIGSIDLPYDLDGKIPFTELVLVDDLLCGIGDSTARVMRGLQQLHDRQSNMRMDLSYALLQPFMQTTDPELYENPQLMKRGLLRLIKLQRMGDLQPIGEQASMASVANGLQDESAIERQFQKATGDNNMSMSAGVDPQQSRTATGARIMAFNQDVLTKDLIDMFTLTSLNADAEMMYLMNRSELADGQPLEFNVQPYKRDYTTDQQDLQAYWMKVEPADFQKDGEIVVEAGSTLADDDEANVTKAQTLLNAAMANPDQLNKATAVKRFLIAMGEGKNLAEWAPPPPQPPKQEVRASMTVAAKWETLDESTRVKVLEASGIANQPPPPPGGPAGGAPPPPGGPSGPLPMAQPGPQEQLLAASALAAAKGNSPFNHGTPR